MQYSFLILLITFLIMLIILIVDDWRKTLLIEEYKVLSRVWSQESSLLDEYRKKSRVWLHGDYPILKDSEVTKERRRVLHKMAEDRRKGTHNRA